jgi:predicted acylesterase/phospholipase RssA
MINRRRSIGRAEIVVAVVVVMIALVASGGCRSGARATVADLEEPTVQPCPDAPPSTPAQMMDTRERTAEIKSARRSSVLGQAVQNAATTGKGAKRLPATRPATRPAVPGLPTPAPQTVIDMLCLSGGGQYGAFGSGFLSGWSHATGPTSRPSFEIVTGISTGSLISTFAFLGPEYDQQLKDAYLDAARGEKVFQSRFLWGFLLSDSIATRKGLEHRLEKMITPDIVRAVALASQDDHRSLLVGTVNLDSGRMTYWSLSRIANIGVKLEQTRPGSLKEAMELYRTILLAATAIPGALPPVLIDRDRYREFFDNDPSCGAIVEPDWTRRATLHCDGGARQNVFAIQLASHLVSQGLWGAQAKVDVYLIANGTITDGPQVTQDWVVKIGERAVGLLLTESMRGNIATVALIGRTYGWNVQLAYLKSTECDELLASQGGDIVNVFNYDFMKCIMDVGERRGASSDEQVRWNRLSDIGLPEPPPQPP